MATGGILYVPLSAPCIGNNDTLISGATLTIYITGGSTLASIFANSGLSTPISNPLTSDASGRFVAQSTLIWADDSQGYDCVLNYNNGTSFTFSSIYPVGPQTNTAGFAPINSPTFTGVPQAPTPASNDNSNKIATTAYVQAQGYAPIASPTFTGTPAGPTASAGTNTTQIATTAFVETAVGVTAPTSTSSGYFKVAGVVLQWTTFTIGSSPSSTVTVNWPIAFPTAIIGDPWVSYDGNTSGGYMITCTAKSTTQATFGKNSSDPNGHSGTVWAFGN